MWGKALNHTATTSHPNFPHVTLLPTTVQQKTFFGAAAAFCREMGSLEE